MSDPTTTPNPDPEDARPDADVVNLDAHRRTPADATPAPIEDGPAELPVYLPAPATETTYTTVPPEVVAGVEAAALRDDPAGDRPLIPQWIRTSEGRATRRRAMTRQARRRLRRWLAKQRTERGHAAQAWRGIRRSHDWMIGFEGVHVRAAKHEAHIAVKEAHDLARRARYTLLPGDREQARKLSAAAQATAIAAVGAHKKAKANRRRIRAMRFMLAYGFPFAALLTAYLASGIAAFLGALLLVLAVEAFIGRKPHRDTVWETEIRSLSDGDPMTEGMLDRAFRAAKVIGNDQRLTFVTPPAIDPNVTNAWHVILDLPDVTVKKARDRVDEIAAAMGIDRTNLDITQVGSNGRRLALWACGEDPFSRTRRNPLIGTEQPVNTWRDGVPLIFDKRGKIHRPTLSDYSWLFAGATRSGKGMGLANLLAAALLDPRVRIRLFDGKGAGEYVPHARVLATFVRRNPKRLYRFLLVLLDEMNRRTDILTELGLSKANEALLDQLGGIELVIIDELATYTAKSGPGRRYAEEITELLAQIAAVGASVGIILAVATQYPEAEIVTPRLRGNLMARMAMRVESPGASNVILGDGMVGQGYDASKIPALKSTRGRGWLTTPDTGIIEARSLFIDEEAGEILPLIETGVRLREAAGCLPGQYDDPVEAAMLRHTGVSAAAGGPDGRGTVVSATVVDHMLTAAEATGRPAVSNAEVIAHLAGIDPDRYARADRETEAAWLSRAGKALKNALVNLGVEFDQVRVVHPDGSRPYGYALADLKAAAAKLDAAA